MKRLNLIFVASYFSVIVLSCSVTRLDVGTSDIEVAVPEIDEHALIERGIINAVKKARQMTDLVFSPLKPIEGNVSVYEPGETYKGLIYSSVKEIGSYVGTRVSFHTFMTAIHNPRSLIYTEKINEPPYHGTNCRAYYGTVCSGLVSYALGLTPEFISGDFPKSELMREVVILDSICVADVLWCKGHVGIITNIEKEDNTITAVEVSEAAQTGCRRQRFSKDYFFNELMSSKFEKVYRYKRINENQNYYPAPQFVAVMDEVPVAFTYNKDLCVNKGDQSCYLINEEVVINTFRDYDFIDIYRNGELFMRDSAHTDDVILNSLPYGLYSARLFWSDGASEETNWIVVDYSVRPCPGENKVFFSSKNARPYSFFFTTVDGSRVSPKTEWTVHSFDEKEIKQGFIEIPEDKINKDCKYFIISFDTDYGIVSVLPQAWKD